MPMRFACALGLLAISLCLSAAASGADGAIPPCAHGKPSTKAKPCRKPAFNPAPVVSPFPADPGSLGIRHNDSDSETIFRSIDPAAGKYEVEVINTSGIGYINQFNWVPPVGFIITSIDNTTGGTCSLVPNPSPGAANPMITCTGAGSGIAPPPCTCAGGGQLIVDFTAQNDHPPTFNGKYWTTYGIVGSYTQITSMTPVPYHIPSFQGPPGANV
jgi:hypothetical protein